MEKIVLSLFLATFSSAIAMQAESGSHKYELELQKVLPMNDSDYVVFEGLKVKRFNRTLYVADGQFTANVDFDDTWTVEANCWRSKLGNNQWELTSFKAPQQPISKFLQEIYFEYMQPDLTPVSNLPIFEKKEEIELFPKGTYKITNYIGDIRTFPPHLQDGTYRIEIFMAKDNVVLCGFIIWWKVYPEIG